MDLSCILEICRKGVMLTREIYLASLDLGHGG